MTDTFYSSDEDQTDFASIPCGNNVSGISKHREAARPPFIGKSMGKRLSGINGKHAPALSSAGIRYCAFTSASVSQPVRLLISVTD